MGATDDLPRNAERYAAAFDKVDLAAAEPPGHVLTCLDARIDPAQFIGLAERAA